MGPRHAIALYVHVPLCRTKCGYCDFYSVPDAGKPAGRITRAILAELDLRRREFPPPVETVFIGGGTPTVLPDECFETLVRSVAHAAGPAVSEFTIEANPGSFDARKADIMTHAGVTRLSLGAQSFHHDELAVLERIHEPDDVSRSVALARRAGIGLINVDLIFGIPGQTLASWLESLDRALDLGVDHLACYSLMYEPGTPLRQRRDHGLLEPIDEELEAEMYLACIDRLTEAGFEHYEISNFARPGCRSRHNLRYWRNEPYLGIGPSAASFLNGWRWRNLPDWRAYCDAIEAGTVPVVDRERLDPVARACESAMLELRLIQGFDLAEFSRRWGVDAVALFAPAVEPLAREGLVEGWPVRLRLSRKGLLVADRIMADLLACADAPAR